MNDKQHEKPVDASVQHQVRKEKLQKIRDVKPAYPNKFKRNALAAHLLHTYGALTREECAEKEIEVLVAGRIMFRRVMGKASFIKIQDMSGQLQVYVNKNALGDTAYEDFLHWDLGDIVGVRGTLFKTKTDELTVNVSSIELLTKALHPLPDKYHGMQDQEMRYRQRYLDLIANPASREVFKKRSQLVHAIRMFLLAQDFTEVETPMMQVLAGGAAARPFITHHNTLDMELYLRVAPELYLKRLVVGGFEKVFEINRNFRNEGLSTRHNPEFTMLEFYIAYADFLDAMQICEELLKNAAQVLHPSLKFTYQEHSIDFSKSFRRLDLLDAVVEFNPELKLAELQDLDTLRKIAKKLGIEVKDGYGIGKLQVEIFEKTVEHRLIQPTFITGYPLEVSPLARQSDHDPELTDRAELFCAGKEIANMFSELNDPDEQRARFKAQMLNKELGDNEAMPYDEDYITALEYGLPPCAGVGIGIDRLVMLLSDSSSIRDVILFPHMRDK